MSELKNQFKASCSWGEGPRDVLLQIHDAVVFGPVNNPGHYTEGSGLATVQADMTIAQARNLIFQLEHAIMSAESLEFSCNQYHEKASIVSDSNLST